jgi:hypothetical protein
MASHRRATHQGKPITVTIYPIAGRQLFFRVPEAFCQECDLTIRTVQRVVEEIGSPPEIRVCIKPWLNYLPQALLRGGWHPPVVTINGKRFSQGVVPDATALREAIWKYLPHLTAQLL